MTTSSRTAFVVALAFVLTATPALCYVTDGATRRRSTSTSTSTSTSQRHGEAQTYIVLVEPPAHTRGADDDEAAHRRWHESFLPGGGGEERASRSRIRHSYTGVVSGFAATLTGGELAAVSRRRGFVRAFPERRLPLLTTRSPGFLGMTPERGVWKAAGYGEGVVVGLLDTGIDAAHPSFRDEGMPPPPAKWKGACMPPARCNKKLVGTASFVYDNNTSDEVGHGTHTAGTAAGRFVDGVSAFGLAAGTASGMAPGAHLAMYKVCNGQGCFESDVLAGIDASVKDGVDVLSISLGGPSLPFDKDPIAIGAFGAMSKGIAVVCAGGNSGPMPFTLSNEAPWMLTVAAGSVDRSFRATVRLGDGEAFDGESLSQDKRFSSKAYPLYYSQGTNYCDFFDVNITGAVVVCDTETPVPSTSSINAVSDYAAYICALLGEASLRTITGDAAATCTAAGSVAEAQLNYPAILVPLRPGVEVTVNRTVTNVGPARSRYTAHVDAVGSGTTMTVKVEPAELVFEEAMERKTFAVTVTVSGGGAGGGGRVVAEGSLRWVSRHHVVQSSIVADSSVAAPSRRSAQDA